MFKEDMYSDTILAFDKKYGDKDIKSIPDSDLLLDFEIVCEAKMTYLSNENARDIIKSLPEILIAEILNRMGRYRRQAEVFSDLIYNKLMGLNNMKNIQYFDDINKKEYDRGWIRNNVGKYVAYKNYKESIKMGSDVYELSDPPYNEEDTKMFLEILVEAGIERFCYTAKNNSDY